MKMITKAKMLMLAVFLLPIYANAELARLQVMATSDLAKAEMIIKELNQLGYGPADIRYENDLYKILTKPYNSLGEANLVKPKLAGDGYYDCFLIMEASDNQMTKIVTAPFGDSVPSVTSLGEFNQEMFDFTVVKPKAKLARRSELEKVSPERAALKKAFAFANTKENASKAIDELDRFIRDFPGSAQIKDAKLSRGYRYISAGDYQTALRAFAQVAEDYPNDPIAGEAKLRMGYLAIKMKDYAEALNLFNAVASGQVASDPDVRLESMLRTAALYHRGKDLEAAEACYALIEDISNDKALTAFAAVHRAGLTLEKAWNGKATFQEAREQCDQILANRLEVPQSIRATACLMALETLAYEKKYSEMLRREAQARVELKNTPEAALGYYWIARARLETGDANGALEILGNITGASETTQKRFANVSVATQARRLAADAYKILGEEEKAEQLLNQR